MAESLPASPGLNRREVLSSATKLNHLSVGVSVEPSRVYPVARLTSGVAGAPNLLTGCSHSLVPLMQQGHARHIPRLYY